MTPKQITCACTLELLSKESQPDGSGGRVHDTFFKERKRINFNINDMYLNYPLKFHLPDLKTVVAAGNRVTQDGSSAPACALAEESQVIRRDCVV